MPLMLKIAFGHRPMMAIISSGSENLAIAHQN
jgi:hypothetical protein